MAKAFFLFLFSLFPLLFFAQSKIPGHYWTKDGHKISGLLKFKPAGMHGGTSKLIYYNEKGKKEKFGPDQLTAFVIEEDSFAVVNQFQKGSNTSFPSDFALVVDTGKINLYQHSRYVYNSGVSAHRGNQQFVSTYIIKPKEDVNYYGIFNYQSYQAYFLSILKNEPTLYQKASSILQEKWKENLPALVREYNEL
jgi:hypothetical protein